MPHASGNVAAEPGRVPGTEGVTPPPVPSAEQAAQRAALAQQLSASGWSPGLFYLAAEQS